MIIFPFNYLCIGTKLTRNYLEDIIPSHGPAWRVSFEVYPEGVKGGWTNIIHFTKGGNYKINGDRIPGVWFHSGTTRLHISSSLNGNKNAYYDSKAIPLRKYTKIEIEQSQQKLRNYGKTYKYTIKIAGVTVFTRVNKKARYFTNVKVYRADPWYNAANVKIKNLVYHNLQNGNVYILYNLSPRPYFSCFYKT